MIYLLALNGAGALRVGDLGAVFGQCERLLHGQVRHVCVKVQALDGAAAPFTRLPAVIAICGLSSEIRNRALNGHGY